ncbi:ascorbate-dependent monooxygenase [Thalassiosira oceanica]|uniref:Ascorbate-dependent monooxygenase n=1 Tax=Thalassiosira oceanica TaxID=159749 RepID=K0RIG5_THAOC|nr:ascorbate-dependent monooxygenase [Thalassiosira oceanica]|eukprot:EJK46452.1 ascorbate-dependent monooxygenase [Thalassiosira oceanica]
MVRGKQLVLSLLLPPLALGDGGGAYFPDLTAEEKSPYTAWLSEAGGVGRLRPERGGGMRGSDVAIYESSTGVLTDAHVVDELAAPVADDCQSWDLADAAVDGDGWLIVEMTRALDTYDAQDHPIRDDVGATVPPTRLIAAWGDGDSVAFHGTNRARGAYSLHSDSVLPEYDLLLKRLEEESDGYFEIREDEHEVKAEDTEYHDVCKTADELGVEIPEGNDGITMIGYVPVIDEDTRRFVHHFVVTSTEDCSDGGDFDALGDTTLSAWAPGDTGTMFPDNVGVQMFGRGKSAVNLNIHYDNPDLVQGKKDSSGMRYYYVFNKREHNAGILQIGDPLVMTPGAISPGLTSYSYSCPGSCTEEVLDTPVTILVESLHMHTTGVRMTNEVKRNGRRFHLATSEVYDFDQQGSFAVQQQPYDLMPGDSFKTTCYYRDGVRFGLSSQEEMCIAFVLYYPEKTISGFGNEIPWMCAYTKGNIQLPTSAGSHPRRPRRRLTTVSLEFISNLSAPCFFQSNGVETLPWGDDKIPRLTLYIAPSAPGGSPSTPTLPSRPDRTAFPTLAVRYRNFPAFSRRKTTGAATYAWPSRYAVRRTTAAEPARSARDSRWIRRSLFPRRSSRAATSPALPCTWTAVAKIARISCLPRLFVARQMKRRNPPDRADFAQRALPPTRTRLSRPASDGVSYTCGQLAEFVGLYNSDDDECKEMLLGEPFCCPKSDSCGFCSEGLTADADTPVPAGSNGISYTCGQLYEFVSIVGSGSDDCNEMLLAEPLCCPSSNSETSTLDKDESADTTTDSSGPCGFCSKGLTVDAKTSLPVAPDGVTYTCGQLYGVVNFVKSGSDDCNDMLMAEPLCCPSSSSEEDTSEPINSTDEFDERADSADESDPGDQDVVQSDPANIPEDPVDTNEDSDASSLSAASLASILCIAIACLLA